MRPIIVFKLFIAYITWSVIGADLLGKNEYHSDNNNYLENNSIKRKRLEFAKENNIPEDTGSLKEYSRTSTELYTSDFNNFNRNDSKMETATTSANARNTASATSSLVEMWVREAQTANEEIERLLQGMIYFSSLPPTMPPFSTMPPSDVTTIQPSQPLNDTACLQGETSETYLFNQLSITSSNATLLLNPNTPQGLAFNFTLSDPLINENICTYPTIQQRYALAVLYYSTGGPFWFDTEGWLQAISECSWFGIICNPDDSETAVNIELASNNLLGTIPDEIVILSSLERIGFFNNQLGSTIPTVLANLTSINVLDFELNQFTGVAISETILQLSTLDQLFFSSNLFTGSIPDNINQLSTLSALWLASNEISGSIPTTIGTMSNMKTLIIYDNNFSGTIPTELGLLTNITNLQLYSNIFEGNVTEGLYNLTKLEVLRIDGNFLTGTLSTNIGLMTKLTDLRLNDNYFSGVLPQELMSLTDLRYLIAGTNIFRGSIPNEFAEFRSLQDIDLSNNEFTGPIPDTIFGAANLTLVYLNKNLLTGKIPISYSDPPNLVDLYLDNNLLTGTVPDVEEGSFSELTELLLQSNDIEGSMPASICALREAMLENLYSDCGGATAQIQCEFPDCCNRCFEGSGTGGSTGDSTGDSAGNGTENGTGESTGGNETASSSTNSTNNNEGGGSETPPTNTTTTNTTSDVGSETSSSSTNTTIDVTVPANRNLKWRRRSIDDLDREKQAALQGQRKLVNNRFRRKLTSFSTPRTHIYRKLVEAIQ